MTDKEKLEKVLEFVTRAHESACNLLEEADEMENKEDFGGFEEDQIIDIEKCDAVTNITSQLLDILRD